MSFKMNFVDEKDMVAGFELLTPGECSFIVKRIYHTDKDDAPLKSSKGEPMIKVVLEATDKNGTSSSIFEYLTPNTVHKAYNMSKAVGRKELYQPDGFDVDQLIGLTGKCKVRTEESPGYNPRNSVSGYIPHPKYKEGYDPTVAPVAPFDPSKVPDDDCPF